MWIYILHLEWLSFYFGRWSICPNFFFFFFFFRCVDPILSIAATLSSGRSIFFNNIDMRSDMRNTKADVNPASDLLAVLGLIREWEEHSYYDETINYCNSHNLSHRSLTFNNGKIWAFSLEMFFEILKDSLLTLSAPGWFSADFFF